MPASYRYATEHFRLTIAAVTGDMFQLVINEAEIHLYASPEEAAAAVATCVTGHPAWDNQGHVTAPAELADWEVTRLEY
jgi:hypothetical protein